MCLVYVGENKLKIIHDECREKDLEPGFPLLCLDLLLQSAEDHVVKGQQQRSQGNIVSLRVHDWGDCPVGSSREPVEMSTPSSIYHPYPYV